MHINQTTCSAFTWASVLPQPFCVSHPASCQTPSTLKSFFRFLLCLYSLLATLCTCGVHFPASISLACVSSRVLFFSSFNSQLFVPLVLPTLSVHPTLARIYASNCTAIVLSVLTLVRTARAFSLFLPLTTFSPPNYDFFHIVLRLPYTNRANRPDVQPIST